jgi:hypothetical protein
MKKVADTVENSTNGKPLQNAVVSLNLGTIESHVAQPLYTANDVGGSPIYSVSTDEDGYYEFYAPNGSYLFKAQYGDIVKYVPDFEVFDESDLQAAVSALPILASGTYTPTLTNVTNLDASTAYLCQYMRLGDIVTVSGRVTVNPTGLTFTDLGITVPIASDFANDYEAAGTGATNATAGGSALVKADTANDGVLLSFTAPLTTSYEMFFTFTYRII